VGHKWRLLTGRFRHDRRAQPIGIARLFLGLGAGAVVFWIVSAVTSPILDMAGEQGSGSVASNGTAWLGTGVGMLPIAFLMISFFGLIAYAVFTREVLR